MEVVAVRLDPVVAHRLRLLAKITGRKQSVFLQQIIESGLGAVEEAHLPAPLLEQIRAGNLPPVPGEEVTDNFEFERQIPLCRSDSVLDLRRKK